ncbi:MAG TPA: PDZ domain-containing protein, partial [Candidimonas sp.]|nr:PDZ domain-containing protein [Candidimonas sp.]
DLPRIVGATKPGKQVPMEVWRKGKAVTVQVKVGDMPSAENETPNAQPEEPKVAPVDVLGLKVTAVPDAVRSKQKFEGGVQVADVEEPAATAGLAPGDIVLTINDTDITGPEQYAKVVAKLDKSRAAALLVMRGDQSQWVTVTPGK